MSIYEKYIKQLIEEEINRSLLEQDLPVEEPADTPADVPAPDAGAAGEAGAPEAGGEEIDLDIGAEGGDIDLDVGGAAGGLEGGELGGDLEDTEGVEGEEGLDVAGGGFGGGFGGGGFSFGSDGEPGLTPDDEEEADTVTTVGPEDVEIPDDPYMAITDEAINLLKTTRQPEVILKSVKSSIQRYFDEFDDATPVIKTLWDTEDITLRDVARRLLLFIKGK